MNAQTAILQEGHHAARRRLRYRPPVIEKISLDYRDQPSLEALAEDVGDTPTGLQKLFTRWAGLSPKAFLQA
jgi:AraC family transcriptional regulator of adaptative response/methylated-DNA-[protein]-cysteine methyltransferase